MGELMDYNRLKLKEAYYKVGDQTGGGAVGTTSLQVYFPPKCTFVGCTVRTITAFASGGSATVALGLNGVATNSLMAATAFDSLPAAGAAGRGVDLDAAPVYSVNETYATITVATAAVTAGTLVVYIKYYEADV